MRDPRFDAPPIPLAVSSTLRASGVALALRFDESQEQYVATATHANVSGEGRADDVRFATLDALYFLAALHDRGETEARAARVQRVEDCASPQRLAVCAARAEEHRVAAFRVRAARRSVLSLWPESAAAEVSA